MNKNEGEIELIRDFKKGDSRAFEKLFQKYHKKLYAFLFNLLHSKEDAEEIVQDTFIKIWQKREDFIDGYSFHSFLFTIAKNAFLNLNRKKINRVVFEDRLNFLEEISSERTDDYIIFKETKEIINTIIEGLPPKRKEIFLLRKIEGLSRKEIAEKLDISIITVDNQLMKANIYLKDELKKYSLLLLILFLN
ncbi:RNA polymerase sigma-70 factor [Maribellus comscasis]|uniref:RNA polymerase sigma factor n=1 Tax=Maribellus comscasis TaxID=2681766 RepID=A0A6I6K522_9BACT|nr:RNA polymerase sigma-70 factor [Maribellus comscasis]QGY47797.1 RNA polymerase sigma-70 factor [Maribellus comscasis]